MIDPAVIAPIRAKLAQLLPFRKQVRPAALASYAPFMDGEMQRVGTTTRDLVDALQSLDPVLEALPDLGGGGGIEDAPSDGNLYGRKDGEWQEVPAAPEGVEEAPEDGTIYGRKDGLWTPVQDGGSGGVEEAPTDGVLYGRKDGIWAPVPTGGGSPYRASAVFWRILATPLNRTLSANFVGLGEVQWQDSGGANFSTGGSAFSSSDFGGGFDSSKAFNGIVASDDGWISANGTKVGQWLAYEHSSEVAPFKVVLWPVSNWTSAFPLQFAVQFSDNEGADWKTVAVFDTATPVVGASQTFNIPEFQP